MVGGVIYLVNMVANWYCHDSADSGAGLRSVHIAAQRWALGWAVRITSVYDIGAASMMSDKA